MKAAVGTFGIVALLALSAVCVPAAEAGTTTQQVQTRLRETRATLTRATAELARIRKELASPRDHVQALQAQTSRLGRTLAQTETQLDAARTALAVVPSPLAVAVAQVRREVDYAEGGVPYSRGQLIAEAAMDYVAGHVSDTAYGYLQLTGAKLPPVRANAALAAQAGICGQAAVAFAVIVGRLGFEARSVQFFYDDPAPDNHVAVEVSYDGGWHFFDPTYGLFWTDTSGSILSIGDVRAGLGTLQKNVAAFTNVFEDAVFGNDSWFETDPATSVAVGAWEVKARTPR